MSEDRLVSDQERLVERLTDAINERAGDGSTGAVAIWHVREALDAVGLSRVIEELKAEVGRLRTDRDQLGEAFAILYDQALNGVICDPHMNPCDSCRRGFALGHAVLDRLDPLWGNFTRPGAKFQPDSAALDEGEETR